MFSSSWTPTKNKLQTLTEEYISNSNQYIAHSEFIKIPAGKYLVIMSTYLKYTNINSSCKMQWNASFKVSFQKTLVKCILLTSISMTSETTHKSTGKSKQRLRENTSEWTWRITYLAPSGFDSNSALEKMDQTRLQITKGRRN